MGSSSLYNVGKTRRLEVGTEIIHMRIRSLEDGTPGSNRETVHDT